MFQLERLKVVEATISQIVGEMYEDRIETTEGMEATVDHIIKLVQQIPYIVQKEREREKEAWNNEDS